MKTIALTDLLGDNMFWKSKTSVSISKTCPTKDCKNFGSGLQNLATICPDYNNYYCFNCGCHYAGYNGKLKFYTKREWEKQFSLPEDSEEARNFFPR